MNITTEFLKTDTHIKGIIHGEIDAFTAPILREKLAEIELAEGLKVELNLSGVSYMDSTGLGVFVGFFKSVKAANSTLELTGLSSRLKRLFDITGLGEIMNIQSVGEEVKLDETV